VRFVRLITWGALVATATAHADGGDADRLFEEGRTLAKAGQYVEACDRFAKSLAIERTIGTELNLADCHEQLGHLREAWGLFVAAAGESEASNDPKRAEFARDRAAALEPKMTTMIVKVAQPALPGLLITISGRPTQSAAEIHEHADPGPIDVIATAPNLPHFKTTETGAPGATVVVEIPPLDTSHVEHPIVQPKKEQVLDGEGDRDPDRVHLAYGLGAGGGVAIAASIGLTLVARNHYNQVADGADCDRITGGIVCNPNGTKAIHDAQRIADYGTVAAIAGALLLGGAAGVYLTAPRVPVQITPTATAQSVGVSISGSF
jgi:hypothetical protein